MLRSMQSAVRRCNYAAPASAPRTFTSSSGPNPERKVTVLGAAGGIGQPLSMLMKLNPLVSTLSLYDLAGTPGVAADCSHVNTRAQVYSLSSFFFFLSSFAFLVFFLCGCFYF